jgi:pyruvate/2-oxoglutarate dehydrogenase complex dihydrolipoamide acyltransferase (E2) component
VKHTILWERPELAFVTGWQKEIGEVVEPFESIATVRIGETEHSVRSEKVGVLFKKCVLAGEAIELGEPLAVLAGVTEPSGDLTRRALPLAAHHAASLRVAPHVYTTLDVTLSELHRLREKAALTASLPFFIAAVAAALREFAVLNGGQREINIALFEDTAVPVVFQADQKSVLQLSRELKTLPKTSPRGATFTITDGLGLAKAQTPVLHQPQVGHLFLGGDAEGNATLCLAHDARFVGNFEAMHFLQAVRKSLEEAHFLFI